MERKRSSQSNTNHQAAGGHPPLFNQRDPENNARSINVTQPPAEPDLLKPSPDQDPSAEGGSSDEPPSFSFCTLPAEKKGTFVAMAFANFAACACFSLLAPFFPSEAAKKGASQTVTGLIFSSFELWIFLSSPIFGTFLTRIGSRFMFLSGLFICGTCSILFGLLDKSPGGTIFIVMCFLVRSVEALGASAFITASFAIIANEFPSHVSTVFGTLETFSGLGLMVGPPIGGALYELGGYGVPFWVMGALLILCVVLIILLLPVQEDQRRPDQGSILSLLSSPLVLVTCLTIVSGSFALGFLDPTLATHLEQFHLSAAIVGLVFIVAPAVYALTAPVWGYLSDRKGLSFPLVVGGNFVGAISFLMLGPSPLLPFLSCELWLVMVSLALGGLGIGSALVCTLKCLLIGAKQVGFEDNLDTFGLISGLFNSAFSLGTFIGPTAGSAVVDSYGFSWASTVSAAIFAFSGILFLLYLVLKKSCHSCCSSSSSSKRNDDDNSGASRRLLGGGVRGDSEVSYHSVDSSSIIVPSSASSIAPDNV